MNQNLKFYPKLEKAKQCILSVKGKTLSIEERAHLATELAAFILMCADHFQTKDEKKQQQNLAKMMEDPIGKVFTTAFADQSFRPHSVYRIARQMVYLLEHFGIPECFSPFQRLQLQLFKAFGLTFPALLVPLAIQALRKETAKVIIPGEKKALLAHIHKRKEEKIRLNLNHLGEAILGEEEASARLDVYLKDLKQDSIDYISIKISTIYSQINLLSWDDTLEHLATQLRKLYRAAIKNTYIGQDGKAHAKFVNLDMEEYKDLSLTKELFKKVLNEDEFKNYSAGIVLQAYIPDSHLIQKELTEWAIERVKNGGAPIKIRLVKGANLAMEQVEASLRVWPQAPYHSKIETDANYKRMLHYALEPEHAKAVNVGIGSHNLFDISYALLLCSEREVLPFITFEMLEGMADSIRRIVHELTGKMILYCAVATKQDFQSAIAYLIRRLDENTGHENFLRYMFNLKPHSDVWDAQVAFFLESFKNLEETDLGPNRTQDRNLPPIEIPITTPFENDADTDFSLPANIKWAADILHTYQNKKFDPIPLVINGKEIYDHLEGHGIDPSKPQETLYTYALATHQHIEETLTVAKASEASWNNVPVEDRCKIIAKFAHLLRVHRKHFIGVMIADGGKSIPEADTEYSEAIDFAEYYLRLMLRYKTYDYLAWTARGTVLVTPPWNFPVSIPAGGILAGLLTGNCVIFKPAPEAVLCGWELVKLFWEAGVPKNVLQFINCVDNPIGSSLIKDPRVNSIILTGATSTAKLFLSLRPSVHLCAETGGKNALIITAMADRDLAIKDLLHSAFGHSGQKCSAASIAILEKEIYESESFLNQLKDAASSLKVGSAWNPQNKITPLINPPAPHLLRALTTLEPGESWLLKPRQDPNSPHIWSPGIKLGVIKGSFTHQTEFFGPILALMKADNLHHALQIANATPYGLTSGIHSLDEREQKKWKASIIAGNCYINRTITGALVQRQPFGGCKKSSFGLGSKAGGPNYLLQFMHPTQKTLPQEKAPVNTWINNLSGALEKFNFSTEELGTWHASVSNYAYWWQRFRRDYDPTKLIGQDNLQRYIPYKKMTIRLYSDNVPLDYLRLFAAALTTECPVQISWKKSGRTFPPKINWQALCPFFNHVEESEEEFLDRVRSGDIKRVRIINKASAELYLAASVSACYINDAPVLASGRIELLNFLREVSLSIDYHRYGNLGIRENEIRKTIF